MRQSEIPYNIHLKEVARKLRNQSTPGEIKLWSHLKNNQTGYDFHRQKPLLNYIVDFYCEDLKLIIEIDGSYHHGEEQYHLDVDRETDLKLYDLKFLRFTEKEIHKDIANVLRVIEGFILDFQDSLRDGLIKDTPL